MIKYIYPDDTYCYRALHTTHAVFRDDEGKLIAKAEKADGSLYEFEIKGFELIATGVEYSCNPIPTVRKGSILPVRWIDLARGIG